MSELLKVAVIGAGHLGQHHARIYAGLSDVELVAVCDTNEAKGKAIAEQHKTEFVNDYGQILDWVQAVSIATPTVSHAEIAHEFLQRGIHCLVEKPIAKNLIEADAIIALAAEKNAVLQIGHVERFNPAFLAIKNKIHQPYFFEAHRLGIFTMRSLDIDVVMDLMVHELDLIASLVNSEVVKLDAVGIPILTPKVDLANARIEFANGCIANITASRVSGEKMRKLRIFQPHEYFSLDFGDQELSMCKLAPPAPGSFLPEIQAGKVEIEKREPLLAELESFVNAIVTKTAPVVSGADGRRALALALETLEKINEHSGKFNFRK